MAFLWEAAAHRGAQAELPCPTGEHATLGMRAQSLISPDKCPRVLSMHSGVC